MKSHQSIILYYVFDFFSTLKNIYKIIDRI